MSRIKAPLALVAATMIALPAAARADEPQGACARTLHRGLTDGPTGIGFFETDFGTGHRACPRTEIVAGERMGAVIDTKNFYGGIALDTRLGGSLALGGGRGELFFALDVLRWQFLQNATLAGTGLSLGQLTAGGSFALIGKEDVLAVYARVMLPTASQPSEVRVVGAEAGVSMEWRPHARIAVHGVVGAHVSGALGGAESIPRGGVLVTVGATVGLATWFAFAADLQVHAGYRASHATPGTDYDREGGIADYIAPAFGLRFRLWRGLGLDVNGTLPVLGSDRHLMLANLLVHYRF